MKKIRILLAALSLAAMVAVFVIPSVAVVARLGWIARLQLVPAVMAVSVAAVALLAVFVALFGRLYCSVICPLGISQDLVRGLAKLCRVPAFRLKGGRKLAVLRLGSLAVFLALVGFGLTGLFEPYGIFGRFLSVGVLRLGEPGTLVTVWALALFVAIVGLGAFVPRGWCNVHCPVGTFLGFFSRFARFRVRLDASKCVKCGLCAKACETGALAQNGDRTVRVDASRCVVCGNCGGVCRAGALKWH